MKIWEIVSYKCTYFTVTSTNPTSDCENSVFWRTSKTYLRTFSCIQRRFDERREATSGVSSLAVVWELIEVVMRDVTRSRRYEDLGNCFTQMCLFDRHQAENATSDCENSVFGVFICIQWRFDESREATSVTSPLPVVWELIKVCIRDVNRSRRYEDLGKCFMKVYSFDRH